MSLRYRKFKNSNGIPFTDTDPVINSEYSEVTLLNLTSQKLVIGIGVNNTTFKSIAVPRGTVKFCICNLFNLSEYIQVRLIGSLSIPKVKFSRVGNFNIFTLRRTVKTKRQRPSPRYHPRSLELSAALKIYAIDSEKILTNQLPNIVIQKYFSPVQKSLFFDLLGHDFPQAGNDNNPFLLAIHCIFSCLERPPTECDFFECIADRAWY